MQSHINSLLRRIKNRILHRNQVFTPLVKIELSKSALLHNLNEFRKLTPHRQVAPVFKSNAYGHGLVQIANVLRDEDIPLFIVDSYFEARTLRNNCIDMPILIIGYSTTETIIENRLDDVCFTITSLEGLKELNKSLNRKIEIQIKIDTGMHRQGMLVEELGEAFEILKNHRYINLNGICSHFSDSDGTDSKFTESQIQTWNGIVDRVKQIFPNIKYIHISNTYGHKYSDQIKANISRLGIGLYGLAEIDGLDLIPVLEMSTIITSVKKVKPGDYVGYNNTYQAEKDMTLATIPVGYYEGLNRKLSNTGFVKIDGQYCKIIGRVSMNITTVDVSDIKNPKIGDKVQVISRTSSDKNSIKSISEIVETIPYETVVKIPEKISRVVVD